MAVLGMNRGMLEPFPGEPMDVAEFLAEGGRQPDLAVWSRITYRPHLCRPRARHPDGASDPGAAVYALTLCIPTLGSRIRL